MFTTDKVDGDHGYLPFYLRLAGELSTRVQVPTIVEFGVRDGSSMEMWRSLFPTGHIIGIDNDELGHAKRDVVGTTFIQGSQEDPLLVETVLAQLRHLHGGRLGDSVNPDLIVDDAGHDGKKAAQCWENFWPHLAPGGYYVIEDWYVGFNSWPQYDNSMIGFINMLLGEFERKGESDVASMHLEYGIVCLRKR